MFMLILPQYLKYGVLIMQKEVTVIIGSPNDKEHLIPLEEKLKELNISYSIEVYSAHRNLPELLDFLKTNQTKIYVTAAGLAAALPGVVASQVKEPVIGVPICVGTLNGIDALLAILHRDTRNGNCKSSKSGF